MIKLTDTPRENHIKGLPWEGSTSVVEMLPENVAGHKFQNLGLAENLK